MKQFKYKKELFEAIKEADGIEIYKITENKKVPMSQYWTKYIELSCHINKKGWTI